MVKEFNMDSFHCPTCKAIDWKKQEGGRLCDLCFTFIPERVFEKIIDNALPEEFRKEREMPWSD